VLARTNLAEIDSGMLTFTDSGDVNRGGVSLAVVALHRASVRCGLRHHKLSSTQLRLPTVLPLSTGIVWVWTGCAPLVVLLRAALPKLLPVQAARLWVHNLRIGFS